MNGKADEGAVIERFSMAYARSQEPVMLAIERAVCGCDFGGNSWTTREQADDLVRLLALGPGVRLLELGSGTGWPGLYLAEKSGCDAHLVDLPEVGLEIARKRAAGMELQGRVAVQRGDAAALPLGNEAFDAISHSDLLCCLVRKRAALAECRRVLRPGGRMAFTVIDVAPGLTPAAYARAIGSGPPFIETAETYAGMLAQTGWRIDVREDLTEEFAAACARQLEADETHGDELARLIGPEDYDQRVAGWRSKLDALNDGLLRRELYATKAAAERY